MKNIDVIDVLTKIGHCILYSKFNKLENHPRVNPFYTSVRENRFSSVLGIFFWAPLPPPWGLGGACPPPLGGLGGLAPPLGAP